MIAVFWKNSLPLLYVLPRWTSCQLARLPAHAAFNSLAPFCVEDAVPETGGRDFFFPVVFVRPPPFTQGSDPVLVESKWEQCSLKGHSDRNEKAELQAPTWCCCETGFCQSQVTLSTFIFAYFWGLSRDLKVRVLLRTIRKSHFCRKLVAQLRTNHLLNSNFIIHRIAGCSI